MAPHMRDAPNVGLHADTATATMVKKDISTTVKSLFRSITDSPE